ncbi:MAG: Na+/H+ antiporter subunit E [Proteobacteria bacterium]|nr:Na+/H+ antiporter subunit E [Pseudomonadota bacterium]MBU1716710.1 Na+/H+ antiporter subunit E [Pseudomonadota bacterium]
MITNYLAAHHLRLADLAGIAAVRFVIFSTVWFLLTGSEMKSWLVGIPAVFFAVGLSLYLSPPGCGKLSFVGGCFFIPFFLRQSFLSGIDVMRRTLSPQRLINPGLVSYTTTLPPGAPLIFFVNTISLLPGTLSADLQGNTVTIHTIDQDLPIWTNIQNLEGRIAVLFNQHEPKENNL